MAVFVLPQQTYAHGIEKAPIADYYNSTMIGPGEFVAKDGMSEAQIQAFLLQKVAGGYCDTNRANSYGPPPSPPWICLFQYTENGKLASRIIYETAQEFGINPMVILVTLQKENSLVTDNWPWPDQYRTAMGYGCPDSTPGVCEASYYGFTNQVRLGTKLLRVGYDRACGNYSSYPGWSTTKYIGNTTIDGKSTYIGNCPTASLYNYTPHRPDSAWLPAGDGSHYYGNYNFITQFNEWFPGVMSLSQIAVYRFYNTNGTHFYTASETEKNNVIARYPGTYKYEGVAYTLNYDSGRNTTPLYRFYVPSNNTHFYSASIAEVNSINARWGYKYKFEGVAYNVSTDPSNSIPVFRFYNTNGTHFYTASVAEMNNINARWGYTYKYEGIAYYIPN